MAGRRLVLGAVAFGLALRLAFGLLYWNGKPLTHDEREYLALAANVWAGRGFTSDLPLEPPHPLVDRFGRAPLYPLVLAPVVATDPDLRAGRLPADVPTSVKVVQALVGAATVWLIALVARRVAGHRAEAIAAWVAAVYPPLVWMCAYALSEAFYASLAMAVAWVLGRVVDDPRDRSAKVAAWVAAAGLLTGLAILARPATLAFVPLAVAGLTWHARLRPAVVFAVATVVAVAPWTARNWQVHGRFVLVASEGGVTFWTGNHPLAIGEGDLAANPQLKRANLELRARHAGRTPEELEPVYYREALEWIAREPAAWARLTAWKAFYSLVPVGPSYRLHSALYFWGSVVPYALVLPFALAGLWGLMRVEARPRALWWLAASALLVGLAFFPQERFRIPVIDPALIVTAACRPARGGPR
jgi:4-amino-4-deoxy-L-arabinose transferase-like glycosyltransferase